MHYRNRNTVHTTHTTTAAPRRRGIHFWGPRHHHHHHNSTTTTVPVHHHRRHVTLGDKISGALMKLRGSLTHRPGVKAAGTRRMHGTDGRGSRRVY